MPSFFQMRKEESMNIYVLRHGTTQWNLEGKIQGSTDIPLHEKGRKEAYLLGEKILPLPIDRIYTSPLKRALETAQIINESTKLPVDTVPALQEVSFGLWEGLDWKEVQKAFPLLFAEIPPNGYVDPPEGETFADAARRICSFVDELKIKQQNCLLVTHKAVIRFLLYCLTKKTPAQTGVVDVANLSILHFQIEDTGDVTWDFL